MAANCPGGKSSNGKLAKSPGSKSSKRRNNQDWGQNVQGANCHPGKTSINLQNEVAFVSSRQAD